MVAYADAAPTYPPSEAGTDKSLINAMDSLTVSRPTKLEYPFAAGDPDAGGFDLLHKARNAPVFVPMAQRPAAQHQFHMHQQQAYANNRAQSRSVSRHAPAPTQSQPSPRGGDVETIGTPSAVQPATVTQVTNAQTSAPPKPPTPQQQPRPGYVSPVPQHDKLTAAQLEEKMARMRQLNASMVAKRLAQETDAKAYEDGIVAERKAQQDKERRLAEANLQVENARRDAAARKLANMQGRAWDADKETKPSPAQLKDEPVSAPASTTDPPSEPVKPEFGVQKVFERAPAPHLPPARFNSGQTIYYAPGPVPAVDVVARSDLIGWGTPPDTPPPRADGAPPSTSQNAVPAQQSAAQAWTQPPANFQHGQQQHLISTAPPPSWPSRSVSQEPSNQQGRIESDKPAVPPGISHAAKSEVPQVARDVQQAGPTEQPAQQEHSNVNAPTQPPAQQPQQSQFQAQGWQNPPASVEQATHSAPQATEARDDGGWGSDYPVAAQAPVPNQQPTQNPPSLTVNTGPARYGAVDSFNTGTATETEPTKAAPPRESGQGFNNAVSTSNEDDGGWGVFDPLASVKASAAAASEQESFLKPPHTEPPRQVQTSAQIPGRGIDSSKWAPRNVQAQSHPQPVVARPDVNATWRAAFNPAPVPEEDLSWEMVNKSSSGPQSTSADQPQPGTNSQQRPSNQASGWHNPAPPNDGGWGPAAPSTNPAPSQQDTSANWQPATNNSGPPAAAPGGWNNGPDSWGPPAHQPSAPTFAQAPTQQFAQASSASGPVNTGDWGTSSQAVQSGPSSWGQQPAAAPVPTQSSNGWNNAGQNPSTSSADQGWGASSAPQQTSQAPSGWGAPFQGQPGSQPAPQPQGHYQPQQGPTSNNQQGLQTLQPPASEPQPAQSQTTPARALYVHPDRLNAVPQAASSAAPSPPAQEFGFAGKGFGFGGGKNLRLDRDDSPFARRPSGGFSGQQSFGGEINAAGGANAVPLGGRPRWGGSNGGASPAPAMNERPAYAQPQSTSAANGWGGSYASGPANGGAVQNVNSSW